MSAPAGIIQLVERFDQQRGVYKSGKYNETQLRNDFLNPFFEALGWDVLNTKGNSEKYREVFHEVSVEVEGKAKAADYAFRIGDKNVFLVEAKKPSVDIEHDPEPAFQVRRYSWSAKLPISLLSDFEQLAVYDCRSKPRIGDLPSVDRVKLYSCRDYVEKWDEIASRFSRDAVLKGSFDEYAASLKGKKGTADVDDDFLEVMEHWRTELAQNIALRNTKLSQRQLNTSVQLTIDRLLFLRICEERGIEPEDNLRNATDGKEVYSDLLELFKLADKKYNSGLFHFNDERGESSYPDKLTPSLTIDDKVLKDILAHLYYPASPYAFKYIPVEILGQVYERFLGKVIRLTPAHQAKVEEKPEVRKAGGVYYTPSYIVTYIVENTVGELLRESSPAEQESKPIRVLDPACGSGSFLLGAYQYLLDWHLHWYETHDPAKWAKGGHPAIFETGSGWQLSPEKRKEILTRHIFGVDIDAQAVEVTKLSLLLKVVEAPGQLSLLGERILPDLGQNIRCGNSLIGPDYYDGVQLSMFDEEETYRVNAFDWQKAFPLISAVGGFDAVIGNPPYIPIEMMSKTEKDYYLNRNHELERKFDSSVIFILEGLKKLNNKGLLGFISSITWQTGENYGKLRESLVLKYGVKQLINLPFDVFKDAYVDTGIYILSAVPSEQYGIFQFQKKCKFPKLENITFNLIPSKLIEGPDFKLILNSDARIIANKFRSSDQFSLLGSITISAQGLAGNVFTKNQNRIKESYMPFLEKGQVHRFSLDIQETSFVDMSDKTSLIQFYKKGPKILIRRVISRQDRILATYSEMELVTKKDINPFILTNDKWNSFFVLGILNSKLISFLYINTSSIATKDDFRQTTLAELRRLPILVFDQNSTLHQKLITLVVNMLDLHKKIIIADLPEEKERLERFIQTTDAQIDRLVYELFGLTDDEIKIVEGSNNQ